MAFALTSVKDESSEVLTIRESVSFNGKRLAVAETATGQFVLCRERERYVLDSAGKRSKLAADGSAAKREKFWKRTADLADFRDALAGKLIAP